MVTGIALASNNFVSKYDKPLQSGTREFEEARRPDAKRTAQTKTKRTPSSQTKTKK